MKKFYTESISKDVLNKETGEIEKEVFIKDVGYTKTIKQGWRMYYIDYDNMLEKVIRSNKDIQVIHSLKQMISRDFVLNINITQEAKKLNMGRDKLSKILSRLVDAGFLIRKDKYFVSNPFMYIPYRANSPLEHQERWKDMVKSDKDFVKKIEDSKEDGEELSDEQQQLLDMLYG